MDGSEAVQHEHPFPADFQNEEALPAQQSPAHTLHLAFDDDRVGTREEPVFLHHILIHAIEFQDGNFAGHSWSQQRFASASVGAQRLEEELLTR
jgi:hypothetical protein